MAASRGWLLVIGLSLSAQSSTPDPLLDFMYAKFVAAFPASKDRPEFLMLANPGISLDPDSLKTPSFEISDLLDQVPQASRTYHPSGNQYSMIYEHVLNSAIVTTYQLPAYRDAVLMVKGTLLDPSRPGQPTPAYAAYLQGQAEYADALDVRSVAREESRATGTPLPSGLDQTLEAARKRWENRGDAAPVREALDALQRLYDSNAQLLFQNLRYDFMGSRLRGDQAHTWLLKDGAGFTLVSSGNPADPDPGPMPILITGVLLARKLVLTGFQTQVAADGGIPLPDRLGQFDLGGPQAGRLALTRRIAMTAGGTSIAVADPQIIAFFCRIVPRSPTPDLKFFK
jgi:hypothetical protein